MSALAHIGIQSPCGRKTVGIKDKSHATCA